MRTVPHASNVRQPTSRGLGMRMQNLLFRLARQLQIQNYPHAGNAPREDIATMTDSNNLMESNIDSTGQAAAAPYGQIITPRIELWRDVIRYSVEGWVGDRTHEMIGLLDHVHRQAGIVGDIVEIGVHQGMLLLLLAAVRRTNERVIGLDVFDSQHANIDNSGSGAYNIAMAAIEKHYSSEASMICLMQIDSMAINSRNISNYIPSNIRLFSVDGGHTREHVLNDLCLAQDSIVSGGVIMLDDFFGPHWPSVTEGYNAFMQSQNKKLAPFLFFQNKLYLTTISEHKTILDAVRTNVRSVFGNDLDSGLWKTVEISGFPVLVRG